MASYLLYRNAQLGIFSYLLKKLYNTAGKKSRKISKNTKYPPLPPCQGIPIFLDPSPARRYNGYQKTNAAFRKLMITFRIQSEERYLWNRTGSASGKF